MYEEVVVCHSAAIRAKSRRESVNRDMIRTYDFAPTFLDYAGPHRAGDMQGRSFRHTWKDTPPAIGGRAMYNGYWMHNTRRDHHVPAHLWRPHERWKLFYYGKPRHERREASDNSA